MKHGAFFLIHKPKNNHSNDTSSPRKKKVRLDNSKGKVMLVVFFDYQGLFYYNFIKEVVTINKQECKEIEVRLRDAIRRKRNQLFKSKHWKFLHDNAPVYRAIIVQDYLAKHSVSVLPHPPYSPVIAPYKIKSESEIQYQRLYNTTRKDKPKIFGGGLAVLIKTSEIKFKEIAYNQSKPTESTTEAQAIEIYLPDETISIINVYHPDNISINTGLIETLSETSSDITIILGDFNAKSPTWGSPVQDNKGQQVEDMLTDLDLTPLNNENNTYLSKSTGTESAIDITAINYNIAPTTQWKILRSAISDYRRILPTLNFKFENVQQKEHWKKIQRKA
ncbi:CLCN3 [Cordylochernes scorpioides]|uniref:CLCN3 n=1 Tax=Cordylochernes scorpioides TaxID=51811 RepID=A0ABY6K0U4_9ARAC|nr:CLCN3 [Cordylochernes scorpioides]